MEPTLRPRLRRGPFEELLDDRPEIARAVVFLEAYGSGLLPLTYAGAEAAVPW
ncbi:MAG: hypothetical protein ABI862_06695 [Ilumatobacteraceae bacterium]